MKKAVKKTLIIAAIFALVGVVLWIIGMSAIGWDFNKLDGTEYTAKSYAATEEIEKININLDTFPIAVKSGESISLDYYEATNSDVTVQGGDGVLDIREKYRFNPFKTGMFNLSKHNHTYVLTVTNGVELTLGGTSIRIVFENMNFENFSVKCTNADIKFVNSQVNNLEVISTNTELKFDGCTLGDVTVDTTNLDINISDTTGDDLVVDCTNLSFDIDDSAFKSVALTGVNADIRANAITTSRLYLHGTNLHCALQPIKQVSELFIEGTNIDADIIINGVQSEYNFIMQGKNLPASGSGSTDKTITVKGTNNKFKLDFIPSATEESKPTAARL